MSSPKLSIGRAQETSRDATVPILHEVVVLQVKDLDRAKSFYQDLGWRLDADLTDDRDRVLQFTPPASNTSIIFTGVTSDQPDSTFPITAWELESPETAWYWWRTTGTRSATNSQNHPHR